MECIIPLITSYNHLELVNGHNCRPVGPVPQKQKLFPLDPDGYSLGHQLIWNW